MKHTILYLDDNPSLTAAVSEYLAKAGYEVDCAHNIEEATTRILQKTYSIVLVDLRLSAAGSLDGFDFACKLQKEAPWMLLVLFSACLTPDIELETIRRRMKVISKPTPLPALRAMIGTYLREKYPLYPVSC